ncbi:MAG TPA: C40 family peptidase [Rhodanobacteraceae bacterium]
MTTLRPLTRLAVTGAVLSLLAACATVTPTRTPTLVPAPAVRGPSATVANNVLIRAIGLVGTPYRWGGNTPTTGFDCSGLVDYVFRTQAGLDLPRTSSEMAALKAPRVARRNLRSGDLVFFGHHHHVNHVGIYVGNGRFVDAPDTGGKVRLDKLDGYYWRSHYLFAKRVLTPGVRAMLAAE